MKKIAKHLFLIMGGDKLLMALNRTPRVLFWHGVHNNPHTFIEAESINKDIFINQIEYLIKHFDIVSINELYHRLKNKKITNNEIVLTFDDGYENNLHTLAPILKAYNLPFTVFVSTNNISNNRLYPTSIARLAIFGSNKKQLLIDTLNKTFSLETDKDKLKTAKTIISELKSSNLSVVNQICNEIVGNFDASYWDGLVEKYDALKVMNWNDLKILIRDYNCTVGSHCLDHICCHDKQDFSEVKTQINESKYIIESNLKTKCDYFAFPNGNYTPLAKIEVENAGYKLGFITGNGRIDTAKPDFSIIPRISIPFNLSTFKIITNLYPR